MTDKRRVTFVSPDTFELWDYRNYDTQGIGGSETAVCELAWRLAERGYDVTVYGPIPEDCDPHWRGTVWRDKADLDPSDEATWVLCRCPEVAKRELNGPVWVQCQDQDYPGRWASADAYERVIALCEAHANYLRQYPFGERVCVSSNAVRLDLLRKVEASGPIVRDAAKCVYTSSPDRGLMQFLLPMWRRIKDFAPGAELHVYYGFDNIENMIRKNADDPRIAGAIEMRDKAFAWFEKLAPYGVHWHGRIPQAELYRELLSAGLWTHPSEFAETSCINCMEAQCAGAVPVTFPTWAVGENVRHGLFVSGPGMADSLTQAEFCQAVAGLVNSPDAQAAIRHEMIPEARARCGWERIVDQYEAWLAGKIAESPQKAVWCE